MTVNDVTTEERLAIEARVEMARAMVEPDSVGLLEWYLRDVPKLLELVRELEAELHVAKGSFEVFAQQVCNDPLCNCEKR